MMCFVKVLKPPEGVFTRIHQPVLPHIDGDKVQRLIEEGLAKSDLQTR